MNKLIKIINNTALVGCGGSGGSGGSGGNSSVILKKKWTKLIGTSNNDIGEYVTTASDGSVYVTGYMNFGGDDDVLLIKYDSNGNRIWTRFLSTDKEDRSFGVATASDGSVYITGNTEGDFDGNTNNGGSDIFLTKYNSAGVKQWTKLLGSSFYDYSGGIAIASDDSVYITATMTRSTNIILYKYDSNGLFQWNTGLVSGNYDVVRSITTASDGSVYITGHTDGDLDGQTNNGSIDALLTKYNSKGEKQWTRFLGAKGNDYSFDVSTASDGSVYITGHTSSNLDGQTNNGLTDIFLTKYNSDGEKKWTKLLGTSINDESYRVRLASDNSVYITGLTYGDLDGQTNNGISDIFLTKYNSNGNKQWTQLLGTNFYEGGYGMTIASDDSVYITGSTRGNLDGETNNGGEDVFLTKYGI